METKPEENVSVIDDFAGLVVGMTRFLTRVSSAEEFKTSKLGLGEWSALTVLAHENSDTNNKQLAKKLGITGQRANQIVDALKKADYASVVASAGDRRQRLISLTPAGKAALTHVNSKLTPRLTEGLASRAKSLSRMNRQLKSLARIAAPIEGDKAEK